MYPSEASPAFGTFVRNIAEILQRNGIPLTYCVIDKTAGKRWFKIIQYSIFYIKTLLYLCTAVRFSGVYVHYILHSGLIFALIPWRIPNVVGHIHGTDVFNEGNSQVSRCKHWLVQRFIDKAETLVVPSEFYKAYVVKNYNCSRQKLVVSPSGGVNTKVFSPPLTGKFSFDGRKRFLVVGRLVPSKGYEVLVEALNQLAFELRQRMHLTIIGNGPLREMITRKLETISGIEQEFIAHLPQGELVKYFQTADFFIFPSERESLGLVGIESMACATPVIAPLNSGISDYLIDGENGVAFEVNNANSLRHAIHACLDMAAADYKVLANNARATSLRYESSEVNQPLIRLFNAKSEL